MFFLKSTTGRLPKKMILMKPDANLKSLKLNKKMQKWIYPNVA